MPICDFGYGGGAGGDRGGVGHVQGKNVNAFNLDGLQSRDWAGSGDDAEPTRVKAQGESFAEAALRAACYENSPFRRHCGCSSYMEGFFQLRNKSVRDNDMAAEKG